MKRYSFFLLFSILVVLLFSCAGKQEVHIPDAVLPKEKMAEVLAEIHIQEAALSLNIIKPEDRSSKEPLYLDILKKQGVEKKLYDESYNFYSQHPELMNAVYGEVITILSRRQAEAQH